MPLRRKGASPAQKEWSSKTTGLVRRVLAKDTDKFSDKVKELGLTDPAQYAKNKELVRWVKERKNYAYVPEELLSELGLTPDLTIGGRDPDWGCWLGEEHHDAHKVNL
jgi:hypothetical protein